MERIEIRLGNSLHAFNEEMLVFAVQELNDILHNARTELYAQAMKKGADGHLTVELWEMEKQAMDIEHEILRAGKYARFIACCIAQTPDQIDKLEKMVELIPYAESRKIYSFFFSSEKALNVLFPGFSFVPADQGREQIPLTSSSAS